MDDARRACCRCPDGDRPGPRLLRSGGKIGVQAERLITGADNAIKARLFQAHCRQEFLLFRRRQFRDLRLNRGRDRDQRRAFCLDRGLYPGEPQIGIQAVFLHIGDIQHGLCSQ